MNFGVSMEINKETLINNINISDEEKNCLDFYIKYRGLYDHIKAYEYLKAFQVDISYANIASLLRYEKRIRRILFKYFGFIEEYFRTIISEKINDDIFDGLSKTTKKKISKEDNIYEGLNKLLFSELVQIIGLLNVTDSFENFLKKNLKPLVELRNAISHNRLLFSNMNFSGCNYGDSKSSSLRNVICNLLNFMPDFLKEEFIHEINYAKRSDNKKHNYQTKWDLPKWVIVDLNSYLNMNL